MNTVDRLFETEPSVTREQALVMIRAALEDEGLALGPRAGREDDVTSVLEGGRKVFRVPCSRVLDLDADRAARAILAAQVRDKYERRDR